jgi:hypothetical protein
MVFVLIMASSFVVTTLLGVLMAMRFGRSRRWASFCLVVGVVVPLAMLLVRAAA